MKNIFIAFILNLSFSIFEFIGGIISGSIAIKSDAIHDFGDALSIGLSLFLEKKSNKPADEKYNFGYGRFSLLGGFIACAVLLSGCFFTFFNGINRLFNPTEINIDLTLIFAIFGFLINLTAMLFTRHGHSHNHKAINLHLLEDLFGWLSVFIGAIIMKFTNLTFIDPLLSIIISLFIFISVLKEIKEIFSIFLLKCPVDYKKVRASIEMLGVSDLKIFQIDNFNICAYVQIYDDCTFIEEIRQRLYKFGINTIIVYKAQNQHLKL